MGSCQDDSRKKGRRSLQLASAGGKECQTNHSEAFAFHVILLPSVRRFVIEQSAGEQGGHND